MSKKKESPKDLMFLVLPRGNALSGASIVKLVLTTFPEFRGSATKLQVVYNFFPLEQKKIKPVGFFGYLTYGNVYVVEDHISRKRNDLHSKS